MRRRAHMWSYWLVPALVVSTGCSSAATSDASRPASEPTSGFPIDVFARISEDPVSDDVAAEFQSILEEMAGGGGMVATVMTSDGTWRGATGSADGARPLQVDDQFAIASITKSVVAAQVMQLVETGELSLDDLATDHLPAGLDFDSNGATIRQLLSHRSGLKDGDRFIMPTLGIDRRHVWTVPEILALSGDPGWPMGSSFEYSNANYVLLGLIVEEVRGRPLAQVLRDGVLALDGMERLVYQPDERPSEPMAMPAGESTTAFELGGGYLPSIASVTGGGPAAAIASDALTLARWWRALCAGEIVSPESLTEMTTVPLTGFPSHEGSYGLGMYNVAGPHAKAAGHTGQDYGFAAWAACLPEQGAVLVVLANQNMDGVSTIARPLVQSLVART